MSTSSLDPQSVQSWRELDHFLSQSLVDEYLTFEGGDVRQVSTYIKSYIVERSHSDISPNEAWASGFTNLRETKENGLMLALDEDSTAYFIDSRDTRFALVHSIGMSAEVDKTIERLVDESQSGFDRAWLPTEFLFSSRAQGRLKGFRFAHQPLAVGTSLNIPEGDYSDEDPVQLPSSFGMSKDESPIKYTEEIQVIKEEELPKRKSTSVNFSSLTARDSETAMNDYLLIRDSGVFQGRRALDWIQYQMREESGGIINHTLYNNGKFTASGTSVGLHRYVAERYRLKYANAIRSIESNHWLGWSASGQGVQHSGEPLYVKFPPDLEIVDLHLFARSIFRAARPFRLFGAFRNISDSRLDVEGIDLHTGDPFSVELTHGWMRIFLPKGTCGNVVARLVTNLQRTTVSGVELVSGSGERLLAG